jgi:hypothetical protein
MMTDERWIWEGTDVVYLRHLTGPTNENQENPPIQDSWCPAEIRTEHLTLV